MKLSKQLTEAARSSWHKTAAGYEMQTSMGLAKLYKKGSGKGWYLSLGDEEVSLGSRASFDHAEGVLKEVGAQPI